MIRPRSLTVRLLLGLIVPLVLSAALIGVGGALVTKRVVDYTSDRLLAGSLRAIAESTTVKDGQVWVDLPPWALGLLDSPQRDSVFYNVRQSGRTLTGYEDLPDFDAAAGAGGPVFRTLTYNGRPIRQSAQAIRVPGVAAPVVISVAQTLESRQAIRSTLLTSVSLMEAGLVALVALLIWPAALWSLRPLEGLRRRLTARSQSGDLDFTPVAVDEVPRELQPVVVAFNTLLGQLERSVEGVRRFTGDASHQMRTPLAILKTHLAVMRRHRRSAVDQQSLSDSLEAVDRLQRLIEQLLALARADAVEDRDERSGDLARAVGASVSLWAGRAAAAGADLVYSPDRSGVAVALADPLIEQIAENLIDNALRYGGPRIRVAVGARDGYGVLEVRDSGRRPPPTDPGRLFERFVRGPDSDGPGSGLGRSIVKALAERCGGDVAAGAAPDGQGFRVIVRLPLRPADPGGRRP